VNLKEGAQMPRRTISFITALVSLWLLAFAVRLMTYHQVFSPVPFTDGSRISVYGDDPPYHVRRIGLTMQSFPWVAYEDSYLAYPSGWRSACWPPLFDWPIAAAAKALGYSPRDQEAWLRLLVYVPPLLGAFTVLIAFFIARRFMDDKAALVSSAVFALMPGHIFYSLLGRVDHHVVEMLSGLVMILLFLKGLEKWGQTTFFPNGSPSGRPPAPWAGMALAVGCGAAMACLKGLTPTRPWIATRSSASR
jgi:asparagine N-glycosylation enzyme membrane subunit Stt3